MTSYVLGFCFGASLSSVVLIRKNRPVWQNGKLNGLGGHVEPGETPEMAMSREFRQEADCDEPLDWKKFGRLWNDKWEVHLFCARFPVNRLLPTCYGEEGPVMVFPVSDVVMGEFSQDLNPVPNLRWLLPMALNFLRGDEKKFLDVEEKVWVG